MLRKLDDIKGDHGFEVMAELMGMAGTFTRDPAMKEALSESTKTGKGIPFARFVEKMPDLIRNNRDQLRKLFAMLTIRTEERTAEDGAVYLADTGETGVTVEEYAAAENAATLVNDFVSMMADQTVRAIFF